jgi:hypothetical protein
MRKSRITEEQIIAILQEQEGGSPTAEVYRPGTASLRRPSTNGRLSTAAWTCRTRVAEEDYKPEQIVEKLYQADVLVAQGTKIFDVIGAAVKVDDVSLHEVQVDRRALHDDILPGASTLKTDCIDN